MGKKIIEIDQEKCIGCGLCANTCQQSAIEIIDGKAQVTRSDCCDGIGNCLPVCPVNAIHFSERDVVAKVTPPAPQGCPGSNLRTLSNSAPAAPKAPAPQSVSALGQWPVQIKLVPEQAPYFNDNHLLIAADCTAYAYGNFHGEFMRNKITLIGCPKLDEADYTEKLTKIITNNRIKSVTVVRMEVPCCGGIERAAINALRAREDLIPWQIVTISIDGKILET